LKKNTALTSQPKKLFYLDKLKGWLMTALIGRNNFNLIFGFFEIGLVTNFWIYALAGRKSGFTYS